MGLVEWQPASLGRYDVPSPRFVQVINPWGAVDKPGKDIRPVVDATISGTNKCFAAWPMSMPTIDSALECIPPGYFLAKRDWKSGFHHLALTEASKRLTGFKHPVTGAVGRFAANPFGISQAPARFWEISNEATRIFYDILHNKMGLKDIVLIVFVDDVLIAAPTHAQIEAAFRVLDSVGDELGIMWKLSKDEGRKHPLREIVFIGFQLSTLGTDSSVSIPQDKLTAYTAELNKLFPNPQTGDRFLREDLESLVGRLGFCAKAYRWGRAYMGGMYDSMNQVQRKAVGRLTSEGARDLQFWQNTLSGENPWDGVTRWANSEWDLVKGTHYTQMATDACRETGGGGWGAVCADSTLSGSWSAKEIEDNHITWLEFKAVTNAITAWAAEFKGKRLVVWSDNSGVVYTINNGPRSPMAKLLVQGLAQQCRALGLELRARHIPGKLNIDADALSRESVRRFEHCTMPAPHITEQWALPGTDALLFAQAGSRVVREQASILGLQRNPQAIADLAELAAAATWLPGSHVWAWPHHTHLMAVLDALTSAWKENPRTQARIIVPHWPTAPWWEAHIGNGQMYKKQRLFEIVSTIPANTLAFTSCSDVELINLQPTPFMLAIVGLEFTNDNMC
jgi:hypothetical protein